MHLVSHVLSLQDDPKSQYLYTVTRVTTIGPLSDITFPQTPEGLPSQTLNLGSYLQGLEGDALPCPFT